MPKKNALSKKCCVFSSSTNFPENKFDKQHDINSLYGMKNQITNEHYLSQKFNLCKRNKNT